jgi:signal transduction histidine kinase
VPLPSARTSSPEIRTVIAAFERLQARVAQLLRARMAMLGGISHDVRTFATRLRLRVEQIPEGVERERAIADISDMIRLLDDALLASRAGVGELATELVELDGIVHAEVDDRRSAGARIDARVASDAMPATVLGDRVALRRVVANLADNALKYGEAAHLMLAIEGPWLVLTIDDEGPGIPPGQRELLLEPFTRMEVSRSRGTGGAGLGLGIVRNLVAAMGGSVSIGDAPGGGARITVRLPVFKP